MSPSSTTTNTPAMRQSCDRCHRQKLRCTRGGTSNTGACDRCLRRRTQCVYSSSLPKGRPSIYHSPNNANTSNNANNNNTTTTTANNESSSSAQPAVVSPPPATPVTPASLSGSSVPHHAGPSDDIPPSSPDVPGSAAAVGCGPSAGTPAAEISNPYGNIMHEIKADPGTAVTSGVSCDAMMGTSIEDFSSDSWRWPAPSLAGDDSMFMDWSSHDASISTFSWEEALDPVTTTTFAPPAVAPLNTFVNDRHIEPGPESLFRPHHHYHGSVGGNGATSGYGSSHAWPIVADNNDPDAVIAQLSELSMRLASLRRSGQALSQPSLGLGNEISTESSEKQSSRGPAWHGRELLDDAAFESVASWLVGGGSGHGSSGTYAPPVRSMRSASEPASRGRGGEILHDIFSTSHRLLEILHGLQLSVTASAPLPTTARASTPPSPPPLSPSSPSSSSSSSFGSRNRSGTGIIRHLIIACYTSLLSTYSAVLMALARDVLGHDQPRQPSNMRSPTGEGARPGSGMPLGQIRLVSVVQLCSYLVRRQHQAVDAYLANSAKESGGKVPSPSIALRSSTGPPSPPDLAGGDAAAEEKWTSSCGKSGHHSHPSLPALVPSICACSDVDELKREMAEVEQRLAQLQSALHI
ncbi:uncharacterized protein C8A04DRAFT_25447 [Dichotomopilus funicola]|uniref:Zn(2)-C6 fungal-type domain-containing protein n=1 Tax=Dichotomopilus funicola TaxID=1934379 RepID=A0AAN6V8L7_9PEZI|nr:hypothetical protein C8A04DRAFT_25447 [Dichotomopilus funicola]